jgi:hypothetical protein
MYNWEWVQNTPHRPATYTKDQYTDWQAVTDRLAARYGTKSAIPTDSAGIDPDIDWETLSDMWAERYRIESGTSNNDDDDRRQEGVVVGEGFIVTLAMH